MSQQDTKLFVSPVAQKDIVDAADYIAKDSFDSALRFFDNTQTTLEFLCGNPEAGSIREFTSPDLRGSRVWPIRGFENWLVFYQAHESELMVIRVLHGARDINKLLR